MVAKKRKSKRQTLQQKYKIIKRCKEHHRKLKKGSLVGGTNQIQRAEALKKSENRIPNAWPYKEELLKEIESAKERMEKVRVQQNQKRREEMMRRRRGELACSENVEGEEKNDRERKRNQNLLSSSISVDLSMKDDQPTKITEEVNNNYGKNSRRAYLSDLRKVIDRSDVLIHVLDSRDPLGTLSKSIEEMVSEYTNKKLVYVLNKADLVPREILEGWLIYLRQFYPAIPFKSNTQNQRSNLGITKGKVLNQRIEILQSSQSVGSEELLNLLKNYCRTDGSSSKAIITVGIVGFPNVGKSSLINSLLRARAVGVSAVPGFTKNLQEVILDKSIRLIDSPGVVFAEGNHPNTALRNCVNIEDMTDVLTPIQAIVEKCPRAYLMQVYNISKFDENDGQQFLAAVAKSLGKLKKGGIPNIDAAARTILHDWNHGKIKYYCKPPTGAFNLRCEGAVLGQQKSDADTLETFGSCSRTEVELGNQNNLYVAVEF